MCKTSWVTTVLLAVVLLGAAANLLVFFRYLQVLNTAQRLQAQAQRLQIATAVARHNVNVARSLAAEALEYSRKNPGMAALLQMHTNLLQRLDLNPAAAAR